MKKHGITQDIPNCLYDDEDDTASTSIMGNGVPPTADPVANSVVGR